MTQETQHTEHETEIARLRREHAAMVEFLQLVEADKSDHNTIPYGTPEWKLAYAAHLARCMLAAIDTPAAASAANGYPASGNAGGTEYYAAPYFELDKGVSIQRNGIFYIASDGEPVLWDSAESIEAAQTEADRLNAADTVAGSGNGGMA